MLIRSGGPSSAGSYRRSSCAAAARRSPASTSPRPAAQGRQVDRSHRAGRDVIHIGSVGPRRWSLIGSVNKPAVFELEAGRHGAGRAGHGRRLHRRGGSQPPDHRASPIATASASAQLRWPDESKRARERRRAALSSQVDARLSARLQNKRVRVRRGGWPANMLTAARQLFCLADALRAAGD